MKICFLVAEYNPFHNGHLRHVEHIKNDLGAEKIIVIMSGNFTQRGEIAVLDKYTRAKHAIIAGADMVIELPTVFANGNAETFAKGAIGIISALGVDGGLCFGVESGEKDEYLRLARALNNESKEYKGALKQYLDGGVSLAKAKFLALKDTSDGKFNEELISSPNNILGVEYTKAILSAGAKLEIFPFERNSCHNEIKLTKGFTSASSIRNALLLKQKKKVKGCVPKFVFKDLQNLSCSFDNMLLTALLTSSTEKLKNLPDCTEGLENRIKALSKDNLDLEQLIDKIATKRYTKSRIRRILVSNLLGITNDVVSEALSAKLYAKILAVNESDKELISTLASTSSIPLLTRKSDVVNLKKTAEKIFKIDTLAVDLYNLAFGVKLNEYQTLFV